MACGAARVKIVTLKKKKPGVLRAKTGHQTRRSELRVDYERLITSVHLNL